MLSRRSFLATSVSAITASFLCEAVPLFGEKKPGIQFPTQPRDRIAIASYPFRDFIDLAPGEKPEGPQHPRMPLKDFPAHVMVKFKIDKVELWTGHFPSTEPSYLQELRSSLDKANAKVVNLAVDGEHSPFSLKADERTKAIAFSKKWIEAATVLGSPSVRTNLPPAGDGDPDLDLAVDSLKQVVEFAASKDVVVHLENDNPVSEDPFLLGKLVEKVKSPWLHTLPDFANTLAQRAEQYAYAGINAMFGHAYAMCHVKAMENNPEGQAVHVDMARTFGYLKAHEYKGFCSMEYDSPGDPYAGTSELIETTLKYLA